MHVAAGSIESTSFKCDKKTSAKFSVNVGSIDIPGLYESSGISSKYICGEEKSEPHTSIKVHAGTISMNFR